MSASRFQRTGARVGAALVAVTLAVAFSAPAQAAPTVDTVIDSAPAASSTATSATFTFHATRGGATFRCRVDSAAQTACTSPITYAGLTTGAHAFSVVATAGGVADPTAATSSWSVVLAGPAPDTIIDSAPAASVRTTSATFAFHSTISGSTFTCKRDAVAAAACTSPITYSGLAQGAHTFTVTATAAGTADPTPAVASWTVDTTAPTAPTSVTTSSDGTHATAQWSGATDAVGVTAYDVYRNGTLLTSIGALTSYTDAAVTTGSVYVYSVRAKDAAGNVSAASPVSAVKVRYPFDAHLTRAPYLTDLVGRHVAVNFATDQSATSATVLYGAVDGTGACTASTSVTPTRRTIIVGPVSEYQWTAGIDLPASGTYCYRVRLGATDLLGQNPSPRFTTQTPFGSTAPYSFAVIGDWGSVDANGQNEGQANTLAQIANSGAQFAVSVGDNGYPNGSQIDYGDLQQTATSSIFGPRYWTVPGGSIPLFAAVGNHGLAGVAHTDISTWTQDRAVATSGGRYQNDSYCCVNGSFAANYGSEWYAFDVGNARFYVLDSAWGDTNGGTATPYANDALAHFAPGTPEYTWLSNDLATHSPQLKFVFSHYPFYSDNNTQASDASLTGAANLEGLLGRNGVQFVFNGHAHIYQRNTPSATGMPVTYVTGGGGATLEPVGPCVTTNDAYAIGWSPTSGVGSACGRGRVPTSAAGVFHFLKVAVNGTTVTVTPTDSTGATFDVQTYTFRIAPDTYLDSTPVVGTTSGSATFAFHATAATGATYACSLDGAAAVACTSPVTYTGLAQKQHTFSVVATANRLKDATPATWAWTVDSTAPTTPGVLTASAASAFGVALSWGAATDNTGVTGYDLYRDGALYRSLGAVTSYLDEGVLGSSTHTYAVRARDVAGNVSGLTATATATTPAPPVPVFADGFESGTLAAWGSKAGLVVQGTTVHGGTHAVEGSTQNGGTYAKVTLPGGPYADAYSRVWFDVLAQPDQVNLLRLRTAAGASIGYVYVETTGQLGFHDDAAGTNTLSSVVPAPGWHALELHVAVGANPGDLGTVELWLDNVRVTDLTSTSVDIGSTPVGGLQVGEVQSGLTYDVAFDDVAFGTARLGPLGDVSAPTAPTAVTAVASSAFSVQVGWGASTDDVGVTAYDVLRDGVVVATVDPGTLAWTDTTVLAGSTHAYAVLARDLAGNGSAIATTDPATTPPAPAPLFSDGFETGSASAWTSSLGLAVQSATVRSGQYAAEANAPTGVSYAKKALPGGPYADAYARVGFDVVSQVGQVTLLRLRDTSIGVGGYVYLTSGGSLAFRSDALATATVSSVAPGPGWHALELHLHVGTNPGDLGTVEVWLDGALVPALSSSAVDLGTSPIGYLQVGDTASSAGWDVVLDDAAFGTSRLGPVGDVTPPSAPTAVTASALSPFSVAVSWGAATDDVGVTAYDVLRDGVAVASVDAATLTFTDTTVLAGTTHAYAVRAHDLAGNVSPLGSAGPVTTPAAAAPSFSDGFETGTTSAWTTSLGLTAQSTTVRSGGYAAEGLAPNGISYAKKALPGGPYADAYARVAFDVVSQAAQVTLLRLRTTATGTGGYVYLTSGGSLAFRSDALANGTVSAVSPGPGWHALELHLHVGTNPGDLGTVEVWLDGALVTDLSSTTVSIGTSPIGNLQVGDTASSAGWDVVLDDAAFGTSRLGPAGDVTAPTAPSGVTALAQSPFSVQVAWAAATDDVGVTAYDVLRDGVAVASIGAATLTFTDTTVLAATTHTYAVRARDLAGNVSPLGSADPVTTPAAAAPVFSDGFEAGTTGAWTTTGGLTVTTSAVHSGTSAAEGVTATTAAFAKKTVPTSSDTYARVAFDVVSQTTALTLLRLRATPTGGSGGFVQLTSTGRLAFRNDTTATTTTSATAPGAGWHVLELHLHVGTNPGDLGTVEVWLDGALVTDLSSTGVSIGTTPQASLQIGDTATGTWDVVFDDAAFGTSRLGV